MADHYDVVVLGAGPAGLATAISLRQQGDISVLVVDAGPPSRERVGESVPPDTMTPLRRLDLADAFLEDGHTVCPGSAVIWGRNQVGYNDFLLNPMGPARRLHRQQFDHLLIRAAAAKGVKICWHTRYAGMYKTDLDKGYRLTFNGGISTVTTAYVVDATGPTARFARDLKVSRHIDDRLFASACFTGVQSGNMTMQTFVESAETGWWYAACLPGNRLIRMFVTDADGLRRVNANNFRDWKAALDKTRLTGPATAGLTLYNPEYHIFPIYSSFLKEVAGENWLAVGDAASCYDPVASQGIYKALNDGVLAGRAVAAALDDKVRVVEEYAAGVTSRYSAYYKNRCYLYGLEERWPESLFWQERIEKKETVHLNSGI